MNAPELHPTEKLLDFAYQELPPDESRQVDQHVQACESCGRALAEIRGVRKVMAPLAAEPPPDAGLESLLAYAQKRAEAARAPVTKRPVRWWWAGLAATAALLMVTMAQLSGPLAERHANGLDGAAQAPIAYEQKQAPSAGSSGGIFPDQAPRAADSKNEVAPDALAPPPPPSAVASAAKSAEARPEHFKESKGQGTWAMRDHRAAPPEGLKKRKRSFTQEEFGRSAAQDDRSLDRGAQLNAAPAPEEKADVRAETESGAWVEGDAEERRAQGVASGMLGGVAGGSAAGAGIAVGGKVGASAGQPGAQAPAAPARAAPKAASNPARTRAAEPSTRRAVLAQDKPAELKDTQREDATPSASDALARLQAELPQLKGAARAQALERICTLELSLGRRQAAEATFHTLEVEFPTAQETARARASLAASPATPGG